MKSRWLRTLLFLAVIPAFLGTTLKAPSAEEPIYRARVGATIDPGQTEVQPIDRDNTPVSPSRAKELYANQVTVTPGRRSQTMADISAIVTNVADRLVQIQITGTNGNNGWPRDLSDSTKNPANLLPNNYGIVGLSLLAAYDMDVTADRCEGSLIIQRRQGSSYLAAACKAGDKLVERAESDPNLVSTDIIFLHALSKVPAVDTADKSEYYQAGLKGLRAFVQKYDTAAKVYDLYNSADINLKQLKIWQLATWVEAAKLYRLRTSGLVGTTFDQWADDLMDKLCSSTCLDSAGGFFYHQSGSSNYVRTAGQAKAVEVLKRFYSHDATRKANLKAGLAYLKGLQFTSTKVDPSCGLFYWGGETRDGRLSPWNGISLEDQCYGIRAMANNFQTSWKKRDLYKGTYWGLNYLIKSMMASVPDEYEVFVDRMDYTSTGEYAVPRVDRNSEAILALYYGCKEGDVTKAGNITAYNALEIVKAHAGLVELNGPQIIAADRVRGLGDEVIDDDDIDAILKDSVADPDRNPINSLVDVLDGE
ncbi:MAG: hypothetical protein AB1611_22090 [bacterium]